MVRLGLRLGKSSTAPSGRASGLMRFGWRFGLDFSLTEAWETAPPSRTSSGLLSLDWGFGRAFHRSLGADAFSIRFVVLGLGLGLGRVFDRSLGADGFFWNSIRMARGSSRANSILLDHKCVKLCQHIAKNPKKGIFH